MLLAAVLLGAFLGSAYSADGPADGTSGGVETCDKIQVMQNVDIDRLKGMWFEWSSYGSAMMIPSHRCQVGFWYPDSDGHTVKALYDFIPRTTSGQPEGTPSTHERITWEIRDDDPAPKGNLVVGVDTLSFGHQELSMHVLDTDYDSYLLIHMCKNIDSTDVTAGYILTRRKFYSMQHINGVYEKVKAALKPNNIALTKFVPASHLTCDNVKFPPTYSIEASPEDSSTSGKP